MLSLEEAISVFVEGFCITKSKTYPYVSRFESGCWVMEDLPARKRARKAEVIAWDKDPSDAIKFAEAQNFDRFFICHLHPSDQLDLIRSQYKAAGYRVLSTEWMFEHSLEDIPRFSSEPEPTLITSKENWDRVPQIASQKRTLTEGTRLYAVFDDSRDFGWVESIPTSNGCTWVSGLHVHSDVRRKGIGSALMSKMLQDDKELGVKQSILLASVAGSKLYPLLGYQEIATLQIFCPIKR